MTSCNVFVLNHSVFSRWQTKLCCWQHTIPCCYPQAVGVILKFGAYKQCIQDKLAYVNLLKSSPAGLIMWRSLLNTCNLRCLAVVVAPPGLEDERDLSIDKCWGDYPIICEMPAYSEVSRALRRLFLFALTCGCSLFAANLLKLCRFFSASAKSNLSLPLFCLLRVSWTSSI